MSMLAWMRLFAKVGPETASRFIGKDIRWGYRMSVWVERIRRESFGISRLWTVELKKAGGQPVVEVV